MFSQTDVSFIQRCSIQETLCVINLVFHQSLKFVLLINRCFLSFIWSSLKLSSCHSSSISHKARDNLFPINPVSFHIFAMLTVYAMYSLHKISCCHERNIKICIHNILPNCISKQIGVYLFSARTCAKMLKVCKKYNRIYYTLKWNKL